MPPIEQLEEDGAADKADLVSSPLTAESRAKTLSGDRNQCPTCSEYFNSTFAFEKHRTGEFNKDRRCRTVEEMQDKGMSKNAAGFWISSAMPTDVSRAHVMSEGEEVVFASMARAHGWIGY